MRSTSIHLFIYPFIHPYSLLSLIAAVCTAMHATTICTKHNTIPIPAGSAGGDGSLVRKVEPEACVDAGGVATCADDDNCGASGVFAFGSEGAGIACSGNKGFGAFLSAKSNTNETKNQPNKNPTKLCRGRGTKR